MADLLSDDEIREQLPDGWDREIGYKEVEVRFTSHEEGGITDADVHMAELVDDIR